MDLEVQEFTRRTEIYKTFKISKYSVFWLEVNFYLDPISLATFVTKLHKISSLCIIRVKQ